MKLGKSRVYTNKDKQKVLANAIRKNQEKISLWKDSNEIWHAAHGPRHVPILALEVIHIK